MTPEPRHGDEATCYCGANITFVALPADLAKINDGPGFWKHKGTNDRFCYLTPDALPEDRAFLAEPDPTAGEPE